MAERSEYAIDHTLMAKIIEKYPILYDKEHKHRFQSAYPREHEAAWSQISDELNLDVESCKSLWSCMKQKFIKYRKRLDKQEPVSAWPVYEILHKWLDRHVKKRRTRHDYFIRRMKTQQRTAIMQASKRTGGIGGGGGGGGVGGDDDDDVDGVDDEWTDLMEDKNTMVKIQLKRKSSVAADLSEDADASTHHQQATHGESKHKKKFKIEVVSEQGTKIYNDNDLFAVADADPTESVGKECEIVVLEKNGGSQISPQIEVIEVKEAAELKAAAVIDAKSTSVNIENHLVKLEQFLSNCVRLVDRYAMENAAADSNDVFGKYIASMIRELPAERRMKMRMNILQYTSELIARELPNA